MLQFDPSSTTAQQFFTIYKITEDKITKTKEIHSKDKYFFVNRAIDGVSIINTLN